MTRFLDAGEIKPIGRTYWKAQSVDKQVPSVIYLLIC